MSPGISRPPTSLLVVLISFNGIIASVSGIGIQGAITCVARLIPGGAVNGFVTGGGDSTVRLWQTPSPDGGAAAADFKMLKCLKVRVA